MLTQTALRTRLFFHRVACRLLICRSFVFAEQLLGKICWKNGKVRGIAEYLEFGELFRFLGICFLHLPLPSTTYCNRKQWTSKRFADSFAWMTSKILNGVADVLRTILAPNRKSEKKQESVTARDRTVKLDRYKKIYIKFVDYRVLLNVFDYQNAETSGLSII